MKCPSILEIQSYIDDELDRLSADELAAHLRNCRNCREQARSLSATAALLQVLSDVPKTTDGAFVPPAPAQEARKTPRKWRWMLVPAAACLLLTAALAVNRRYFSPARDDDALFTAFIEAYYEAPTLDYLPEYCDFGLGGRLP